MYIYIYVSKINQYVNVLHIVDLGIYGRSRNCQGQGGSDNRRKGITIMTSVIFGNVR